MSHYRVTRHDTNADHFGRHPVVVMGVVAAPDFRTADRFARNKWNCNDYQWLDLENVNRLSTRRRERAMADRIYTTEA
ncbi:hypothetical protein K2D_16350 [Planctomycetes bacterium K2D]|nr:hypothetical protein K2D_16350 [Planctomycetes bacterium K2D]